MSALHKATLCLGLAMIALSCRSVPRPGTGDLTFRVRWTGPADLDLYVTSPAEERVDFLHRDVPSGGKLDFDCNVTHLVIAPAGSEGAANPPDETTEDQPAKYVKETCDPALENIYWPRGRALEGEYQVSVFLANRDQAKGEDRYRFQVLVGGHPKAELTGRVVDLEAKPVLGTVVLPLREEVPVFQEMEIPVVEDP